MFQLDELLKIASKRENLINVNAISCGDRIGKTPYVVDKTLYRGDFTFTYLAKNTVNDQLVVIKEFFPMSDFVYQEMTLSLKRTSDNRVELKEESDDAVRHFHMLKTTFKEEAESLKKIKQNRHVVKVIDTLFENNTTYMITEYLPYPSLSILLKEKLLKPRQAIGIFLKLLQAVKSIHSSGHVHKSIRPNNIYISEDHVILGDYAVKKGGNGIKLNHASIYNELYIAPETLLGKPVASTADIYSLGKILEYLMEHIGYRSGNLRSVDMGEDFQTGKVDFLLRDSVIEEPEERIQTIDEMIDLLHPKIIIKNNHKSFLKILLASALSLLATTLLIKSDLVQYFAVESDDIKVEESQIVFQDELADFRMVSEKVNYYFDDELIFKWLDNDDDVYDVYLEENGETCCTNPLVIHQKSVDLSGFALNPGYYTLVVTKSSRETIRHAFRVKEGLKFSSEVEPVFDFESYAFYLSDDMVINWTTMLDDFSRVKVFDMNSQKLKYDSMTDQNFLDLVTLNLEVGEYMFSVQSINDFNQTRYDHTKVRIFDEDDVKPPTMITKNHASMTTNGHIEWLPVEGEVYLKIINLRNGEMFSKVCEPGVTTVSLEPYHLTIGAYEVYTSHLKDGKPSVTILKQIHVVGSKLY